MPPSPLFPLWLSFFCGVAGKAVGVKTSKNRHDFFAKKSDPACNVELPRFLTHPHLDPKTAGAFMVSKFRSTEGHPYNCATDSGVLTCENDKHYFTVKYPLPTVYAPCNGTITAVRVEDMGTQYEISPDGYPDWGVCVFHIAPNSNYTAGDHVTSGQALGTHYTIDTLSDLAVRHYGPGGCNNTSAFCHMTDEVLKQYGITSREEAYKLMVIPEGWRNACPSNCTNANDPMPPALTCSVPELSPPPVWTPPFLL